MPIGSSGRPQEPLHVFAMLLALALAAFAGGALGVVWHWLAGDAPGADEVQALTQPDTVQAPEPEPSGPPAPPRPSPNP